MIDANKDKQHEEDHQIVERVKEELRSWEYYEGQLYDSITAPNLVILLQKLLGIKGWTPKHTEIVEESEERFKCHTAGEEVDI